VLLLVCLLYFLEIIERKRNYRKRTFMKMKATVSSLLLILSFCSIFTISSGQAQLVALGPYSSPSLVHNDIIYCEDGTLLMSTTGGLYLRKPGEPFHKVEEVFNNIYFHPRFTKGNDGGIVAWDANRPIEITYDNAQTWETRFALLPTFSIPQFQGVALSGDTLLFTHSAGLDYIVGTDVVSTPIPSLQGIDLRVLEISGNLMIAAIQGSTMYVSTDHGASWIARALPFAMHSLSRVRLIGHQLFVAISGQGMWHSEDYGANWALKNTGCDQLPYYISEYDGVIYSVSDKPYRYDQTNETWTPLADPAPGASEFVIAVNESSIFVIGFQKWSESDDSGDSWTDVSANYIMGESLIDLAEGPDGSIYTMALGKGLYRKTSNEKEFALWKAANGGSFRIYDNKAYVLQHGIVGLQVWDLATGNEVEVSIMTGDMFRVDIELVGGETFIATASEGVLKRTGQDSWENFSNGLSGAGLTTKKIGTDGSKLYLATDNGLYHTAIADDNWIKYETGASQPSVSSFIVQDDVIITAYSVGESRISEDAGVTWGPLNMPIPSGYFPLQDLHFKDDVLYAVAIDKLLVSFDMGSTWTYEEFTEPTSGYYMEDVMVTADSIFIGTIESGILAMKKKSPQTISFPAIPEKAYGDPDFSLAATSSAGLPITFVSSNPEVATVNGATVTILGAGTTEISASANGNADFYPARRSTPVSRALVVNKGSQTIAFDVLTSRTKGDAPFELNASATSGLPVSFSSASGGITLSGNIATIVAAGRATIIASQAGDGNYLSAPMVEQSFCVNPVKPTITVGAPGEEMTLTSSNAEGNQWFREGEAIAGALASSYTTDESGSYAVQTTVGDCVSAMSESFGLVVTGINDLSESGMKIYPNPSSDFVIVEVRTAQREDLTLEVFDMVGRLVLNQNGSTNTAEQLDLSTYRTGMYRVVARSASARYSGSISKK
jgi:photosystem II stability/assembly factor-like uncharacterized protein